MDKNNCSKHIGELARDMCGEAEYYQDCFHCPTLICCGIHKFARELYAKGYRKQSDVAREIFEEIEEALFNNHDLDLHSDYPMPHYYEELKDDIAELKKKYMEEGKCG